MFGLCGTIYNLSNEKIKEEICKKKWVFVVYDLVYKLLLLFSVLITYDKIECIGVHDSLYTAEFYEWACLDV